MRIKKGIPYLTVSLCGAVAIGAMMSLLISWAVPAAGPQDRVNAAYAAMGGDDAQILLARARRYEEIFGTEGA